MGIDIRRYRKRPESSTRLKKAGRAYLFVPLPAFPAIYSFAPIFFSFVGLVGLGGPIGQSYETPESHKINSRCRASLKYIFSVGHAGVFRSYGERYSRMQAPSTRIRKSPPEIPDSGSGHLQKWIFPKGAAKNNFPIFFSNPSFIICRISKWGSYFSINSASHGPIPVI
jgi:hypothetical protein